MKNTFLLLLVAFSFLGIGSCSKDNPVVEDPLARLPPETQTGANTFGVTINGKVYIPRDPTGGNGVFPNSKGMIFWGTSTYAWNEIEIKDGASAVGFQMYLHMQNFQNMGIGQYILSQSNFHNNIDSISLSHIYFKIWDANINNYAYYGSVLNESLVNITRHSGGIVSGNFSGKFIRYDSPFDYIQILDGRFDINTQTLPNHPFP